MKKGERRNTMLLETGKFLIDISKLVFGGIILAGIMEYETLNQTTLLITGSFVVILGFIIGVLLVVMSKPKKQE